MTYNPAGGTTYTLQSSISSTQNTITLSSFKVPVSNVNITMSLMNTDIAFATIAPRTSQSEFISFTGITQNADGTATLTGVTRGLNKTFPFTENSSFKLPHSGGSQFILSDAPSVFNKYSVLENDETITGRKRFPSGGSASAPLIGATYSAPTQQNEIATKKYVDDTASFGAPLATTTTPGLIALGSTTQIEAGVVLGASNAFIGLTNQQYGARKIIGYARTGGSANAYTMSATTAISGYATGQIVGFEASFTNSGNATLNVNGLGAKNLFLGGTGLFPGAITTNTYVGAVYDGTEFEIVESSGLFRNVNTPSTVALRDNAGNIQVATTPVAGVDATSKTYVDSIGTGFVTSAIPGIAVANTTRNVATIPIVGGTLGTNKGIRIRLITQANNTGAIGTITYTVSYGGSTIGACNFVSSSPNTFVANQVTDILLMGAESASAQKSSLMTTKTMTSGSGLAGAVSESSTTSTSIDSTVDRNILISCDTNNSASTGTIIGYFVEKIV